MIARYQDPIPKEQVKPLAEMNHEGGRGCGARSRGRARGFNGMMFYVGWRWYGVEVITRSLNVVDGTTTFNSATLAAVGSGLILQDLKIQNTAGAVKQQAVALHVGADRVVINRCNIEAYQDTLYAFSLRQFYRDCTIFGTVDFIFGNTAVVFQNCNLIARKPMGGQQNLVTTQGRIDPNQNTGWF